MSRIIAGIAGLAIAASLMGANTGHATGINGVAGRTAGAAYDTSRLLSIGGDTTEILYALGFGDRVVAVDSTSQFPPEATSKKSVGYMRALSTEGVLATGATLILASAQAGPPEVVRALKTSSVPIVMLPDNAGPDSLIEKVRLVGGAVVAEQKAEALAARLAEQFRALEAKRSRIDKPARAILVLSITAGRALVGGRGTTADIMLGLAGAKNAAGGMNGYKPVSDEGLIGLAPDVVIAVNRQSGEDTAAEIASLLGFKALSAGRTVPVITMDAAYLLGFGPRAPDAAGELMTKLYPDLPH